MWLKYGWQSRLPRGTRMHVTMPTVRLPLFKKIAIVIIMLLLLSLYMMVKIEDKFGRTIQTMAAIRAQQLAVTAINEAVAQELGKGLAYQDLMVVHKDSAGRVVMIQPNVVNINQLQANTSLAINKALRQLGSEQIAIPMGQITENRLFAHLGPAVRVTVKPVGTVTTKVINDFEAQGINQTHHSLVLKVEADMQIVVPLEEKKVQVSTDMIIADNILLGEVPQFLLDNKT